MYIFPIELLIICWTDLITIEKSCLVIDFTKSNGRRQFNNYSV